MPLRALVDLGIEDVDCGVHVRVLRKWTVKNRSTKEDVFVNMIIVDASGYQMEIVIHKILIPRFAPLIMEGSVYYFGQFLVQRNTTSFRVTAPKFRIVLLPDSVCEELVDCADIPKFSFRFLETGGFKDAFEGQDFLFDLAGKMVQCDATELLCDEMASIKKKNIQIRLIDGEIVKVILWDSLVDQLDNYLATESEIGTVLTITSVYVHKYHGEYFFSSSCASKMHCNLHYPPGHPLLDFSTSSGVPRSDGEICQSLIVPSSVKSMEALNAAGPI
ncbi:unnamed protein product [Linum trigynum]|uniref:Replication protein A 70 kDa DNA-binding subunit B/D first OB fold domain-containing protein n=1 Tax=Linum trigynum TaxID=586398 RepID=A0AAV2EIG1_9ROSI